MKKTGLITGVSIDRHNMQIGRPKGRPRHFPAKLNKKYLISFIYKTCSVAFPPTHIFTLMWKGPGAVAGLFHPQTIC